MRDAARRVAGRGDRRAPRDRACGRWARSTRCASSPRPIAWGHGSQLPPSCTACAWLRERAATGSCCSPARTIPIRPARRDRGGLCGACRRVHPDRARGAAHVAPRRGSTSSRAATATAGGRRRRASPRSRPGPTRSSTCARCPRGTYLGLPGAPPLPPFHGSDWFTLSRRAVDAVLAAPRRASLDHFLHTIVPTEAFVHTVLANSGLRLATTTAATSRFEPPTRRTRASSACDDLDAALASGADFARKFDDPARARRDRPAA